MQSVYAACPVCGAEESIVLYWDEGDWSVGIGPGPDIAEQGCNCDLSDAQENALRAGYRIEDFQP